MDIETTIDRERLLERMPQGARDAGMHSEWSPYVLPTEVSVSAAHGMLRLDFAYIDREASGSPTYIDQVVIYLGANSGRIMTLKSDLLTKPSDWLAVVAREFIPAVEALRTIRFSPNSLAVRIVLENVLKQFGKEEIEINLGQLHPD